MNIGPAPTLVHQLFCSTSHTVCVRGDWRKSLSSIELLDPDKPVQVTGDLHTAAGGNLTPVSEPGDLWLREAVYLRYVEESTLALGYSLRPLTFHKTTHIWQKQKRSERQGERQRRENAGNA